jgi:hypothetical protein
LARYATWPSWVAVEATRRTEGIPHDDIEHDDS